jgi:NAD(P)-dependent dehydrogenase (short-subunit alcohol dehydrogenase family)
MGAGGGSQAQGIVLVTGGARGLGRALAGEFTRRGWDVAAIDLPGTHWGAVPEELIALGGRGVYVGHADVRSAEQVREAVAQVEAKLGPVTMLVANAGVGIDTPIEPFAAEAFREQVDVNLTGVANSIAAVLPGMIQRGRGQIAAIASLAGYRGLPGLAGYSASKAGVIALMESLRVDLRRHNIRCTTVCPGWIRTGVYHTLTSIKPTAMDVEKAARLIVRGVLAGRQYVAFPWWLRGMLAANRMMPVRMSDWVLRFFEGIWGRR